MAKKSAIENNLRKQRLVKKFAARRKRLLDLANDQARPMEERFEARIRLAALPRNGAIVRVIDYRLDGVVDAEPVYRLVTTILDHEKAPATELAALYHERWEIETAFDELKTHLRGARIVLRSKTPDLVRQEFYGLLMAHFAVRALMHDAALKADEDPDQLSFLHAIRIIRRKLSVYSAIPPSAEKSLS